MQILAIVVPFLACAAPLAYARRAHLRLADASQKRRKNSAICQMQAFGQIALESKSGIMLRSPSAARVCVQ